MKKALLILASLVLISTPAFANWFLVWDANPPADSVAYYNVYFDNNLIGTSLNPEWDMGTQVNEGCWSVAAVNDVDMVGTMSDPLCRNNPGKVNGLGLEKRN